MSIADPDDPTTGPDTRGALSHLRILDFTALVQGPLATQILGDLGADVIKFERLDGEWSRHWGIGNGRTHGELDSFLAFNRNKRSVAVDLKDPATRERILALAEDADVVVENFRPGVMDRLGLGYADFAARNQAIVYACSSGWGQTGPYVTRPGQDMLAQAASGIHFFQGTRDLPPTPIGIGVADLFTGLYLVVAILAAVSHRQETGEGQRVEVDLFSCVTALQQQELTYFLSHGSIPERPTRNLGAVFVTAPFGTYATADGHLVIAMTPCPVLAEALDLPEIAVFDTNEKMLEHREAIYDLVAARLATDTTANWIDGAPRARRVDRAGPGLRHARGRSTAPPQRPALGRAGRGRLRTGDGADVPDRWFADPHVADSRPRSPGRAPPRRAHHGRHGRRGPRPAASDAATTDPNDRRRPHDPPVRDAR